MRPGPKKLILFLGISLFPVFALASILFPGQGGTGSSVLPSFGQLLAGTEAGLYIATSSPTVLGLTATYSTSTNATSTTFAATTICLSADCKTAWPVGGSGGSKWATSSDGFSIQPNSATGIIVTNSTTTAATTTNLAVTTINKTGTGIVTNLNADLLDGQHAAAFLTAETDPVVKAINGLVKSNGSTISAALAGTDYQAPIAAGLTTQYWRGDKSWQLLNQAAVAGLTTAEIPTFNGIRTSQSSSEAPGYILTGNRPNIWFNATALTGGVAFNVIKTRASNVQNPTSIVNWGAVGVYGGANDGPATSPTLEYMYFEGSSTASPWENPAIRITSDNKIGIGTIGTWTKPTYPLQFAGTAKFSGIVDAANFVATSSAANSTFAGKVGIGTTTPYAKLSVVGEVVAANFTGTTTATSTLAGPVVFAKSAITQETTLATTTSMTVDWSTAGQQLIRLGNAATTIGFTNYQAGQTLRLNVCNPAEVASTVTWTGVLWPGGTAPTHTTTASKCDLFTFAASNGTSTLIIQGGYAQNY